MIHDGAPETLELAEVLAWGHPWHGLVTDGTLDAGGGVTMSYRQPEGDFSGRTMLLEVPAAPGSGMATEVVASEAAEGRRWLDYALLSGSRTQLYEQRTDLGWIYVDAAGTRWGVEVATSFSTLQDEVDFTFTFTQFGELTGAAADEHVVVVEDVDIGQDTPSITGGTTGTIEVVDVNKTGGKVIAMIRNKTRDATLNASLSTDAKLTHRLVRTLGWLEYVVTGSGEDIEVAVNVLADRDTTFGEAFSDVTGTVTQLCHVWEDGGIYSALQGSEFDYTREYGLRDRLIGYAYNSTGVATGVTLAIETTFVALQTMSLSDDYFEYESNGDTTTTVTISWGGYSVDLEQTATSNSSGSGSCGDPGAICTYDSGAGFCAGQTGTSPATAQPLMTDAQRHEAIRATASIWAYKYSPTVHGFYSPAKASPVTPAKYSKVVHRGGSSSTVHERDAGDPNEFVTYGSDQPVDGLVTFASDDLVCYV